MEKTVYKRLILDPRCLRPKYENHPKRVYTQALDAIKEALSIARNYYEESANDNTCEVQLLEKLEEDVRSNMLSTEN